MASYEWHARRRNYEKELEEKMCGLEVADSHPLKAITVTVTQISSTEARGGQDKGAKVRGDFVDPLSQGGPLELAFEGIDPLSRLAAEADPLSAAKPKPSKIDTVVKGGSEADDLDETFEPWHCKRTSILAKYTTSEKLSITTSFLSSSDKEKMVIKAQATVTDKVKTRLEQLDDFEEGSVQEMLNLSQQDYVKRIEELNQALIQAWDQDQRVKALKIAIQCAKLLADVSVIPFYPSKFVLITDILDTFGNLVYDRLLEKAQYIPPGGTKPVQLPKNFTPDQVPEQAKETCRNWFFKIASIRELIPRFYVETAILHCYNFLKPGEYAEALKRLSNMTRGFGDPLVAIYARCYLSRVGIKVAPGIRDHLMPCFNDFLTTFNQVQGDSVQNILALQKLEMPRYLTLYSPALDWLLQCLAHRSSEQLLTQTLDKCKQHCNNALLLNSIMSAFQPQYIASRAQEFVELIRDCEETGFPKHLLYRTLGLCLVVAQTPQDQCLAVLNEVWKSVVKLKTPADYIGCAEVWIEFVVKNFGKRELSTFLGDIIKHMTPDRAFEDFYPQLQSVVSKVVAHLHDFGVLFSLDKFLPFINMFQRESVKVEVCKSIAEAFSKHQQEDVNDPVVINAMMFVCKTMHDTVDALTLEDEKRVIAGLIASFVRRVSFGRDFEQQLSFYVEARGSFTNLDPVLVQLIQSVNTLAMETRKVVKGNHSRKTAAFVRACAAYCFITIPSLTSQFLQLQLYLLSGQVAVLNQCYSQGDAFFKAAISLLPEVPKSMEMDGKVRSTEAMVVEYLLNFISTLLVVPDNPESGVLYLLRGLLNVLQEYVWDVQSDARVIIYTRVLALLSAASQEAYLHHADKVDANDAMYGSDPKFLGEVGNIAGTIVDQILAHLKTLTAPENAKRQSGLALELFGTLVAHGDLTKQPVFTLALNLWNLAHKNGQADPKLSRRTLEYVKRPRDGAEGQAFQTLAAKMSG